MSSNIFVSHTEINHVLAFRRNAAEIGRELEWFRIYSEELMGGEPILDAARYAWEAVREGYGE